jgi:hypothetical protein
MFELKMLFLIVAVLLALSWCAVARHPKPASPPGTLATLRYSPRLRLLAIVLALALPGVFVVVVIAVPWQRVLDLALAGCLSGVLALLGGLLLVEVERVAMFVSASGVTRHSPWSGSHTLAWSQIARVSYSPANQWVVLESNATRVRASRYLVGFDQLAQAVRENLPPATWQPAKRIIELHSTS